MSSPPDSLRAPSRIGYGRQTIDEDDVRAVVRALQSDWLTQGPALEGFEEALAELCGARHAFAVTNGTAALHLANLALEVDASTRAVTTANTFLASASASSACGARVEFVDVERESANLDVRDLAEVCEVGDPPDLVTVVHFAGLVCDMQGVLELKRRHGFRLIEDASHALGARYRADGRSWRVGEHPEVDLTCFSFHPVKHITTGEGGAVLCSDPALARRLRRLRSHGVDRDLGLLPFGLPAGRPQRTQQSVPPAWFGPMIELGLNCRLSEIQAALGKSQLAKLPSFLDARREIAARYRELLEDCPGLELLAAGETEDEHAHHLFVVRVAAARRDALMESLRDEGISTQLHYYPVPLQPYYREPVSEELFPEAVRHARTSISLPIYPGLSAEDQLRVVEALRRRLEA